jgi:hypothetical protein
MRRSSTLRSGFCALASAAISLAVLPSSTFGLATFNNTFGLPAGLQNDIVRIGETEPGKTPGTTTGFVGTGTIIYTQPDSNGGNWYDILTADHVADGGSIGLPTALAVGFGSINSANAFTYMNPGGDKTNWPLQVFSTAQNVIYAGAYGKGTVDLALIAVDVPANAPANVIQPAGLLTNTAANTSLPILNAYVNNAGTGNPQQIVQAGYGSQSTVTSTKIGGVNTNVYQVNTGTYGTALTGTNNLTAVGVAGVTNGFAPANRVYNYTGIRGTFAFTTAAGVVTSGTTYINSGDSGGPTFESAQQQLGFPGLGLIGVHSTSTDSSNDAMDGNLYDIPGVNVWTDVSAAQYVNTFTVASGTVQNGINPDTFNNIPFSTINVPEPSAAVVLVAGAGMLLMRRARKLAAA